MLSQKRVLSYLEQEVLEENSERGAQGGEKEIGGGEKRNWKRTIMGITRKAV